jgi:hypothetical protein
MLLHGPFVGGAYIYIDPTPSKNVSAGNTMLSRATWVQSRRWGAWSARCGPAPGLAWGGAWYERGPCALRGCGVTASLAGWQGMGAPCLSQTASQPASHPASHPITWGVAVVSGKKCVAGQTRTNPTNPSYFMRTFRVRTRTNALDMVCPGSGRVWGGPEISRLYIPPILALDATPHPV